MTDPSPFLSLRQQYIPPLPPVLVNIQNLVAVDAAFTIEPHEKALAHSLEQLFPQTYGQPAVTFEQKLAGGDEERTLKVGVVLSGGQAPGGHNVISGLYDALKKLHPKNELIGFRNGPGGIVKNQYIRITDELLSRYRNTGGFDIIGSGRTKISSLKQFQATKQTVEAHGLDGLVVVGGDDSNTNAALIAEYFAQQKLKTKCIGVPKTIDGDLAGEHIETSFGFDTCAKVYSNEIGNIARDARSAAKYWFFIKMMGRSASHITLECAMQTRPNVALISEEVQARGVSMKQLVCEVADVVVARSRINKNYGIVLVPEGLIEFIPEFRSLIQELNRVLSVELHHTVLQALKKAETKTEYVEGILSPETAKCFGDLPIEIQIQLILDRDPHGNVNVSQIETEKLLGEMVQQELELRARQDTAKFDTKFDARFHFCGYQGRAAFPTNFDSKYCYALGFVAVSLLASGKNGMMACVKHLSKSTDEWLPAGIPITSMMNIEERHGKPKPVIKKALVELDSKKYLEFERQRSQWVLQDAYRYPGPVQFHGPQSLTDDANFHLRARL